MKLRYNKFTFGLLLAGTLAMMVVMFFTGRPLNTAATPTGILCLEFAKTGAEVEQVLSAWQSASSANTNIIRAAEVNTYLDFIFLFFYSFFLFVFCRRIAASVTNKKLSGLFHLLSVLALVAGLLDVLENIGMLVSLDGGISHGTALYTSIAAKVKWGFVIEIIGSIMAGLVYKKWFSKKTSLN